MDRFKEASEEFWGAWVSTDWSHFDLFPVIPPKIEDVVDYWSLYCAGGEL